MFRAYTFFFQNRLEIHSFSAYIPRRKNSVKIDTSRIVQFERARIYRWVQKKFFVTETFRLHSENAGEYASGQRHPLLSKGSLIFALNLIEKYYANQSEQAHHTIMSYM